MTDETTSATVASTAIAKRTPGFHGNKSSMKMMTKTASVRSRYRKVSFDSFKIYIMRLLRKNGIEDIGVTSLALQALDAITMHFIHMTGRELQRLRRFTKKKTVDAGEMRTAMRVMARHSDLRYWLVQAGERAVKVYAEQREESKALETA